MRERTEGERLFTGIVEELGRVVALDRPPGARPSGTARLTVAAPGVVADASPGSSIAVDGVCLTVTSVREDTFTADVMGETLARTTLGGYVPGREVDLERAVRADQRLGGHIVQGHVDGTGELVDLAPTDGWTTAGFALPYGLGRFVAEKGSIALDGVSLTVVAVTGDTFTVGLIPETLRRTVLGRKRPGDKVNVEVDVVAKYVDRLTTYATERVA